MCSMEPEPASLQAAAGTGVGQEWDRSRGNLSVTQILHWGEAAAPRHEEPHSWALLPHGKSWKFGSPREIHPDVPLICNFTVFFRDLPQTYRHHINNFRDIYFSGYLPFISMSRHLMPQTIPIQMSLKWTDVLYLIAWWLPGLDWSSQWWIG